MAAFASETEARHADIEQWLGEEYVDEMSSDAGCVREAPGDETTPSFQVCLRAV